MPPDPNRVPRQPRSMRAVGRHRSLHAQGDVFQLRYLAQQADALVEGIDDLIAATELAAPVRKRQPYVLVRKVAGAPVNEEARWERAIWSEWRQPSSEFVPGFCSSLASYQVMLRDANTDKGWGEVDLMGRSPEGKTAEKLAVRLPASRRLSSRAAGRASKRDVEAPVRDRRGGRRARDPDRGQRERERACRAVGGLHGERQATAALRNARRPRLRVPHPGV